MGVCFTKSAIDDIIANKQLPHESRTYMGKAVASNILQCTCIYLPLARPFLRSLPEAFEAVCGGTGRNPPTAWW